MEGQARPTVITLLVDHDIEGQAFLLWGTLSAAYHRQVFLSQLEQPPEQRAWDIALGSWIDTVNFPLFDPYHWIALGGPLDWIGEAPELQQLYEEASRTVDRTHQQELLRQTQRHTHDQAYFLFLYNPIKLYAVNKAVEFVPYVSTTLKLAETAVTEQHWSVRKQKASGRE
jgi:ABC-type transport system substrate-binding protein